MLHALLGGGFSLLAVRGGRMKLLVLKEPRKKR